MGTSLYVIKNEFEKRVIHEGLSTIDVLYLAISRDSSSFEQLDQCSLEQRGRRLFYDSDTELFLSFERNEKTRYDFPELDERIHQMWRENKKRYPTIKAFREMRITEILAIPEEDPGLEGPYQIFDLIAEVDLKDKTIKSSSSELSFQGFEKCRYQLPEGWRFLDC